MAVHGPRGELIRIQIDRDPARGDWIVEQVSDRCPNLGGNAHRCAVGDNGVEDHRHKDRYCDLVLRWSKESGAGKGDIQGLFAGEAGFDVARKFSDAFGSHFLGSRRAIQRDDYFLPRHGPVMNVG